MLSLLNRIWVENQKRAIVVGGSGALGSSVISEFKKWETTCIDFKENKEASVNIILQETENTEQHLESAATKLNGKYDMIMCAAGGWCSGDIESDNVFSQMEMSLRSNIYPSLLTSHLATKFSAEMGLIMYTGSLLSYKENTPSMLSYGISKNLVHSLALNMAKREELTTENIVVCILPDILNTEANRKGMPTADFSKWISPKKIAEIIFQWAQGINTPKNGSFVAFKPGKEITQEYL